MYYFIETTLVFIAETVIDWKMFVLMQKKWFYNTLLISILGPRDEKREGDPIAERKNKIFLTF